ncbi:sulfotransferase family protein [Solicola sp. PLA-1-18]|uniref:sulfotransferase family protein n=1 Tax=Solicola sp. PLA-1-18 TaxID=3380532 RepID=UPI003B75FCF1
MVIRLIGAGLPRTGTSSLREALRHVLGAPVYHMSEALAHPEHAPTWVAALQGHPPVWDNFLTGYVAGVDAPFSNCWRELAEAYPDAPVLLSRRATPETWYRSMAATVLPRTRAMVSGGDGDPTAAIFGLIFAELAVDIDDPQAMTAGYERWLAQVRSEISPSRLVEWQPGDGWTPICRALDVPVPEFDFPHVNSTADYRARHPNLTAVPEIDDRPDA